MKKCLKCDSLYEIFSHEDSCNICSDGTKSSSPTKKKSILDKINLKTLPASGYSSLLPYQIPQVRDILLEIMGTKSPSIVVDATSHIGGDVIHFSKIWDTCKIIAVDIDQKAIDCLRINIKNFCSNTERFEVVCEDCTSWIEANRIKADLYYFDPPWGGPSYTDEDEVFLFLSGKPIASVINDVIDYDLTDRIVLKVPRNFALSDFQKNVKGFVKVFPIKKPRKKGVIAYNLILICK